MRSIKHTARRKINTLAGWVWDHTLTQGEETDCWDSETLDPDQIEYALTVIATALEEVDDETFLILATLLQDVCNNIYAERFPDFVNPRSGLGIGWVQYLSNRRVLAAVTDPEQMHARAERLAAAAEADEATEHFGFDPEDVTSPEDQAFIVQLRAEEAAADAAEAQAGQDVLAQVTGNDDVVPFEKEKDTPILTLVADDPTHLAAIVANPATAYTNGEPA